MQNRVPTPRDQCPPIPHFDPVPRLCKRHDGWTPERQRAFVDALAETGSVRHAASRINMSSEGAYYLRRRPGGARGCGRNRLTRAAIYMIRQCTPRPLRAFSA
ncbi:hypothetical protein [Sphingomonas sp. LaA6.9]|uniref:hypothetical protein n=1 Tax=Sphingomonas sp. LaA6.9 TaxID=2919914 RepID=UPI001F4FE3AD|nr:hypothetical protein [Sphingomonas sp. LaA6.9]MCJ8158478.1 hypothetical protein [Sphingomonas sp. LaA6.9]